MTSQTRTYLTSGGQLFAHQIRMLVQVSKVSLYAAGGLLLVWGLISFLWILEVQDLYLRLAYLWADAKLTFYEIFRGQQALYHVPLSVYHFWGEGWQEWSAWHFTQHPHVKARAVFVDHQIGAWFKEGFLCQGPLVFGLSWGATLLLFVRKGRQKRARILERGARLVPPGTLKKMLKKQNRQSDLRLDDLPLLKGSETSHFLLTGTTGSGKTNVFHTLLPQIRARGDRGIIVDLTGDYVTRYYREGHDILINPYDQRSLGWSPWGDCQTAAHYDALAAAIVPKHQDEFWSEAGKVLLSAALKKFKEAGTCDLEDLYHLLVCSDFSFFTKFFQNTKAAAYTHKDGERMVHSLRATLANHVQFLELLIGFKTLFSLREWIQTPHHPDQWVFLSAQADQRESLRPLFAALIDTGILALMSEKPDVNRRVWFVIDELPALQKVPSLERGLAELRKYGGCLLCGVQSVSQLETTYSPQTARTLLGLFNTKFFLRSLDPTTSSWVSRSLGEAETSEHIENVSYGANTIRDGVSLNKQTQTKPLVLPTELATLEDLTGYLKLPGNFPITKLSLTYKKGEDLAAPFLGQETAPSPSFTPETKASQPQEAHDAFPIQGETP